MEVRRGSESNEIAEVETHETWGVVGVLHRGNVYLILDPTIDTFGSDFVLGVLL